MGSRNRRLHMLLGPQGMMPALCERGLLLQQERLAGASLLVFANKQDIEGALTAEEIRTELGLDEITTTKRHWRIEGCSAFTGAGLAAGVDWVVSDISSRIWMHD